MVLVPSFLTLGILVLSVVGGAAVTLSAGGLTLLRTQRIPKAATLVYLISRLLIVWNATTVCKHFTLVT